MPWEKDTVDGRNPAPVEVGSLSSLSHYLQGFIHTRWLAGFLASLFPRLRHLGALSGPCRCMGSFEAFAYRTSWALKDSRCGVPGFFWGWFRWFHEGTFQHQQHSFDWRYWKKYSIYILYSLFLSFWCWFWAENIPYNLGLYFLLVILDHWMNHAGPGNCLPGRK